MDGFQKTKKACGEFSHHKLQADDKVCHQLGRVLRKSADKAN
jgi:hypothetical protein